MGWELGLRQLLLLKELGLEGVRGQSCRAGQGRRYWDWFREPRHRWEDLLDLGDLRNLRGDGVGLEEAGEIIQGLRVG